MKASHLVKIHKVINSCKTQEQLGICRKWFRKLDKGASTISLIDYKHLVSAVVKRRRELI